MIGQKVFRLQLWLLSIFCVTGVQAAASSSSPVHEKMIALKPEGDIFVKADGVVFYVLNLIEPTVSTFITPDFIGKAMSVYGALAYRIKDQNTVIVGFDERVDRMISGENEEYNLNVKNFKDCMEQLGVERYTRYKRIKPDLYSTEGSEKPDESASIAQLPRDYFVSPDEDAKIVSANLFPIRPIPVRPNSVFAKPRYTEPTLTGAVSLNLNNLSSVGMASTPIKRFSTSGVYTKKRPFSLSNNQYSNFR